MQTTVKDKSIQTPDAPVEAPEAAEAGIKAIGEAELAKAQETLQKYKDGKKSLEQRIVENDKWYRLRHWQTLEKGKNAGQQVEPTSAWLFNAIANKHADAMDNFPSANILPREENDKDEAKRLSSIIPVILDQCDFEETYSNCWDSKLKGGTAIYGVFWDQSKLNGLGDISINEIDILNIFWEPGISDIQKSRNVFTVELVDNELLEAQYPQLIGKLGGDTGLVTQYEHDDNIDTSEMSVVVDWYYKRPSEEGKTILHYCKYCGDTILYASENDPAMAEGWYQHGDYPFVFDPLFAIEGSPAGLGYIDIGKSAQEYIDRGNKALMENLLVNAKPRYFVSANGGINEDEMADTNKSFVHYEGTRPSDSIMAMTPATLNNIYAELVSRKIDELKEVTGNRDISTGGTTSGVTAASAIAAMQEAGSKLSRDASKASYRRYRRMILLVIELIRQFYTMPRTFRITGNGVAEGGGEEFISFDNAAMQPQQQEPIAGGDMGIRLPLYDVEITAQKASPYSKMAQNELALQLYGAGFFAPPNAEAALVALDMMDFDHKDELIQKVQQNSQMFQMLQQLMAMVNPAAPAAPGAEPNPFMGGVPEAPNLGAEVKEPKNVADARQRVADSTAPV